VTHPEAVPVVCAIIERGTAVLAARRRPEQTNGNLWEFPGGKVHAGETLAAALSREIAEELGIGVVPLRSIAPVRWEYPWITIDLFPFVCSIAPDAVPQKLDHADVAFFDAAQLWSLDWAPADRVVAQQYRASQSSPTASPMPQ
jgi:8-oxo-dGTP diphosphatase